MSLSQHVEPHRRPAPLGVLASIILAAVGGFAGGVILEHGPTYLHIHVAKPVLGDAGPRVAEAPEIAAAPQPTEPSLYATPEKSSEPRLVGAEARIVLRDGAKAFVVLQDTAPASWGRGKIRASESEGMLTTLRQNIKQSALPQEYKAWKHANVTLFDETGFACSGSIASFALLEQFAGDGFVRDSWEEYGEGPALVGVVSVGNGSCKSAVWARHSDLDAPTLGRIANATKAERREAARMFRKSAPYKTIQSRFEAEGQRGAWDRYWDSELTIRAIRSSGQEFLFVEAQVGGCGDFDGQLAMLFERQEDGSLQPVHNGETFTTNIEAAADFDGDGDLDFVSQGDGWDRALRVRKSTGLSTTSENHVGIYFCRC